MPDDVQPIKLDAISEQEVLALAQEGLRCPWSKCSVTSGNGSKIPFDLRGRLFEIDIPNDCQADVSWNVIAMKECGNVLQRGRFDVFHNADCQPTVWMTRRIQCLGYQAPDHAVRSIRVVLAVFVLDDVFLDSQLRLI